MNSDDVLIWPDGCWCFRSELSEFGYRGDDFRVVPVGTSEWHELIEDRFPL